MSLGFKHMLLVQIVTMFQQTQPEPTGTNEERSQQFKDSPAGMGQIPGLSCFIFVSFLTLSDADDNSEGRQHEMLLIFLRHNTWKLS